MPRFPGETQESRGRPVEERSQVGDRFVRGREARRALKHNERGFKGSGQRTGQLPRSAHDWRIAKTTALRKFVGRESYLAIRSVIVRVSDRLKALSVNSKSAGAVRRQRSTVFNCGGQ